MARIPPSLTWLTGDKFTVVKGRGGVAVVERVGQQVMTISMPLSWYLFLAFPYISSLFLLFVSNVLFLQTLAVEESNFRRNYLRWSRSLGDSDVRSSI